MLFLVAVTCKAAQNPFGLLHLRGDADSHEQPAVSPAVRAKKGHRNSRMQHGTESLGGFVRFMCEVDNQPMS